MKDKSIIIVISAILILTIVGAVFWFVKNKEENSNKEVPQKEIVTQENNQDQKESDIKEIDTSSWKTYRNEEFGFEVKYPESWVVQFKGNDYGVKDESVDISWNGNRIVIFPTEKSESLCYSKGFEGDFEKLHIDKYTEEFFIKKSDNEKLYACSTDIDNYPKSWSEKAFIEMDYDINISNTVKSIVQSISFLEDTIDSTSLKIYGSRVGIQRENDFTNTSNWLIKKNDTLDFSFSYPQNAKIMDEENCYRVEYKLGFVIFFLPIEGDMRCGARTGVGVLPDNVDVIDYLTIGKEKYKASGFNAVIDTKSEDFFKPETRYFYDFNHMFDLNKEENCGNAGGCKRVVYGIYKEVSTPLSKEDIDNTMNTLRAIIESINYNIP